MYVTYALVDCNNFYCSCERVFNPKMKKYPVLVLSNNDGCAIARSDEVKALGVKMGHPYFQLKDLIKEHNIQVFSSNFALYGDMSRRVKGVLNKFSPRIENYSIDESFLDLTEFKKKDLEDHGKLIKETVFKWTSIPVSVGIGHTKTLSKVANKVAKKNKSMNGVFDLTKLSDKEIDEVLESIGVGDIWGVGRQHEKMLISYGIINAKMLKYVDLDWIQSKTSVVGRRTVKELRGDPCIEFKEFVDAKKGIACTRTFGHYIEDYSQLAERIAMFTDNAAMKLRQQNSIAKKITVFVNTDIYNPGIDQYSNVHTTKILHPTYDTSELTRYALEILKQLYIPHLKYHKGGVILSDILPDTAAPLDIFDENSIIYRAKRKTLFKAVDNLNNKWGWNTIHLASEGGKAQWDMRQANKSPRYTTSWLELPKVKV